MDHAAQCERLGADLGVNYRKDDFVASTLRATGGRGADVILDMVGGDYVERNYAAAALDGRIAQIAFVSSTVPKTGADPEAQKALLDRFHAGYGQWVAENAALSFGDGLPGCAIPQIEKDRPYGTG